MIYLESPQYHTTSVSRYPSKRKEEYYSVIKTDGLIVEHWHGTLKVVGSCPAVKRTYFA